GHVPTYAAPVAAPTAEALAPAGENGRVAAADDETVRFDQPFGGGDDFDEKEPTAVLQVERMDVPQQDAPAVEEPEPVTAGDASESIDLSNPEPATPAEALIAEEPPAEEPAAALPMSEPAAEAEPAAAALGPGHRG